MGRTYSISGKNIALGPDNYYNFDEFSSPAPFLEFVLPSTPKDLSGVKGQWILVDELLWHRLQGLDGIGGFWGSFSFA